MAPSNKPSASEAEAGSQQPDVPLTTNNAGETGGLAVPPDLPNTTLTAPTMVQKVLSGGWSMNKSTTVATWLQYRTKIKVVQYNS